MKYNIDTVWERFYSLLKLERRDILQVFYYAIFAGILSLSLPLGVQSIVNLIQGAQISTSWIILVALVSLGVMFTGTLQVMQMRIIETLQQRIFTRSSFELSYRFPKINMQELRNHYPPELANRFFDTMSIQKGLSKILIDVPTALIQILFALLLLSFYHPFFILFGVSLLTVMYFVFQVTIRRGLETSLVESKQKYKVAHWIQEIARTVVSFKLSGNTNFTLEKNDALVSDYLKARESHFRVIKMQYIKMIAFKVAVTTGLLIIGGALVLNQKMNIGQFVAAEIIILLVIASVEKLIVSLETLYDILTSIEKLGQIVDMELEPQTGKTPNFDNGIEIELSDVHYTVADREQAILSDINIKIPSGEVLLVHGTSGSGKSSLLRLLAGVNLPTKGSVFINENNLKSMQLTHYRLQLGMSLADESPFVGTLYENLTLGNANVSAALLREAIDVIGLQHFIKSEPLGLDTMIYPEGKRLSSTVTKKILLTRAILRQPKMLLLENPLDDLPIQESQRIIDYLTAPNQKWSIVVVSSNPYWEEKCNQSITLSEGKLTVVS